MTTAQVERELRRPAPRPRTEGEWLWDELDKLDEAAAEKRRCFAARRLPRVRHAAIGRPHCRGLRRDRVIPAEILPALAADRQSGMKWKDVAVKYRISISGAYRNYQVALDLANGKA